MGKTLGFIVAAAAILVAQTADARSISYRVARHSGRQNPALNNYLSARYDHLLQTNLRFRHYRMWKECHTINFSAELHASCLASFDQYTPIVPGAR